MVSFKRLCTDKDELMIKHSHHGLCPIPYYVIVDIAYILFFFSFFSLNFFFFLILFFDGQDNSNSIKVVLIHKTLTYSDIWE